MIAASLAYAGMGAFIKLAAAENVPVAQITFYRCLLSLGAVYVILRMSAIPIATPHWRAHITRSVTGVGSLAAYYTALTLLPLATVTTLNYTTPLFVAMAMLAIGAWRLRVDMLVALVAGLLGTALMLSPSLDSAQWWGATLAAASAVLGAGSILSIRNLGQYNEPTWRTVFYFSLLATVLTFPWYLSSLPWERLPSAWACMLVLGIGATATVGQLFATIAYQKGDTLVAASLGYSQVIFASVLGLWLWSELPAAQAWVGMALILASGLATTLRSSGEK
jgi:drug/metabolite transporter (DMT)-like permease